MLVLSRRRNQEIRIGDDIVVKVLEVRGNTVRLGLAAPPEISIIRTELDESKGSKTIRKEEPQ